MSNSKETNKNAFKEATKNLLHAGKTWVDAAIQTGSDQYTKRIHRTRKSSAPSLSSLKHLYS